MAWQRAGRITIWVGIVPNSRERMSSASRVLLICLASVAIVAASVLGFTAMRVLTGGPDEGSSIGEAKIGGPFSLVDGDGKTVSDVDYRGKLMLVYFGFTYCPDVCPTELQAMSQAVDLLGRDAGEVQPIFITIDPERDTPELVKAYAANFGSMTGLTGSAEQVADAARAYRVYYRKAESAASTEYLMDHSSIIYLMGRDGRFLTHFSRGAKPEVIATALRKFL